MKILKKMYFAGALLIAMTACSNEEVLDALPEDSKENVYMSLAIEMPNAHGYTRSIDEGKNQHAGTSGEQKISNLMVLIYDENGKNAQTVSYEADKLVPNAPNPIDPNKTIIYTLPAFKVSTPGKKKVVVLVNPMDKKFDAALSDMAFIKQVQTLKSEEVAAISTENQFMMTNVNRSENSDGAVDVEVTAKNGKNNPAVIQVAVERVVAKIEDTSKSYEFAIEGGSGDKVTFTDVALINGNTKFFPIMQIKGNQAGGDKNDYVVDPNFEGQTEATKQDFYANSFTSFPVVDGKLAKSLSTEPRACFYTLENTMIATEQMNAYTTGLYYKAVYHLKSAPEGGNIYQYGGKLYTWEGFQKEAAANGVKLGDLTDNSSQEDFEKIAVKKYEKGVCYYPYWIRHVGTVDGKLTPMEFAVVRNNYYQVNINTVKSIGDHKPVTPNPTTPDELQESYLTVTVKVMPWIVRENKIDF